MLCYVWKIKNVDNKKNVILLQMQIRIHTKSEMNRPQAEGNVNLCLYSRGRSSNKLHENYEAGEESSTLFINNKYETQMCHFWLLVWLNWIIEGQ